MPGSLRLSIPVLLVSCTMPGRPHTTDDPAPGVTVNGHVITVPELQRAVVYSGPRELIALKLHELLLEEWRTRLIAQGVGQSEDYVIADSTVEAALAHGLGERLAAHPGRKASEVAAALSEGDPNHILRGKRVMMLVDKMFMPGPSAEWPAITRTTLNTVMSTTESRDEFWRELEARERDENGNPVPQPEFWKQMLRFMILNLLEKSDRIRYPADGLPEDVALRVYDRTWPTDVAFREVRPNVTERAAELAVRERIAREVLEKELVAAGHFLDDASFEESFDRAVEAADADAQYSQSVLDLETIATIFQGYPSFDTFRHRWRLQKSFEKMIDHEIDENALRRHAKNHSLLADAEVDVEFIPMSSESEAARVLTAIRSGAIDFARARELHGEFAARDKERGRLTRASQRGIRIALRESEFADLHQARSIAAFLFREAEIGEIVGPLRGADAWYLARVRSRTPVGPATTGLDGTTRGFVREHFVRHRFLEWARDRIARATIRRMPPW